MLYYVYMERVSTLKLLRILALCLLVSALCAHACSCGDSNDGKSVLVDIPTDTVFQTSSPLPTEKSTQAPTQAPLLFSSLTTGKSFLVQPEYHPIAVMIENAPAARPQSGLLEADIIYEMVVEGGMSRLMCIFNDTLPTVVGPVRSARIYFLNAQKEWDCPIVHFGGPSDVGRPSYIYGSNTDYIKLRVDGLKGKWYKYFWRSDAHTSPHDVFTDLTVIANEEYSYTPEFQNQFLFSENATYENAEAFSKVTLSMTKNASDKAEFVFDAATQRMLRYQGGKPFMTVSESHDASAQSVTTQYSCANLIIQYAKSYAIPGDSSNRQMVELVGSGECEYFVNGKHIKGTWSRPLLESPTTYSLLDGTQLVLAPGNTWIMCLPLNGMIVVE